MSDFDQAQKVEDVERISNILNQKTKKDKKNPFLNINGGIDLIEIFPVYKDKKKRKKRGE